MDGPVKDLQAPVAEKKIAKVMKARNHKDIIMEEDGDEYGRGDIFLSFHCQTSRPFSRQALLAGFLSALLKRSVVLSPPHDGITSLAIFPAVQLAHRCSLGLLPAMVCRIQSRLRMLTEQFYKNINRVAKELIYPREGPSPRVEMIYEYIMTCDVCAL